MPSDTAARASLSLAPHVRACEHDGQVVMLDLRRNRYLGAPAAKLAALSGVVRGWPQVQSGVAPDPALRADPDRLAAGLLQRGLLTLDAAPLACPAALPGAARSLNADDAAVSAALGARRMLRFARCSVVASISLRLRSLHAIANAVSARRSRASVRSHQQSASALQDAVAAHVRLRPLLYDTHDRCLHDALSLIHFLAGEQWFPHWVIGIMTRPFRAHAWVQSGDLVLNDLHDNVRRYTPILIA